MSKPTSRSFGSGADVPELADSRGERYDQFGSKDRC